MALNSANQVGANSDGESSSFSSSSITANNSSSSVSEREHGLGTEKRKSSPSSQEARGRKRPKNAHAMRAMQGGVNQVTGDDDAKCAPESAAGGVKAEGQFGREAGTVEEDGFGPVHQCILGGQPSRILNHQHLNPENESFVNVTQHAGIMKTAYFIESEIRANYLRRQSESTPHSSSTQGESNSDKDIIYYQSNSILVLVSDKSRLESILQEKDFFFDIWSNGDAMVVIYSSDPNGKAGTSHTAYEKLEYEKLPYRGEWSRVPERYDERNYFRKGQVVKHYNKFYICEKEKISFEQKKFKPGGDERYWTEAKDSKRAKQPITPKAQVIDLERDSVLISHKRMRLTGAYSNWRLCRNKHQPFRVSMTVCTISDALGKLFYRKPNDRSTQFQYDAIVVNHEDLRNHCRQKKNKKKSDNSEFKVEKTLIKYSKHKLLIRLFESTVSRCEFDAVEASHSASRLMRAESRRVASQHREINRLKKKKEFSTFLSFFRREAQTLWKKQDKSGQEKKSFIEYLKEEKFWERSDDLKPWIRHFMDVNREHPDKLKEEYGYAEDKVSLWWHTFYESIKKATWGLCFT